MTTKTLPLTLIVAAACFLPAQSFDLTNSPTTYKNQERRPFRVGEITIRQDKGKLKVQATLSGFPDDTVFPEASAEVFADRDGNRSNDTLRVTLSNGKLEDELIIKQPTNYIQVESLLRYTDGRPPVCFQDVLQISEK